MYKITVTKQIIFSFNSMNVVNPNDSQHTLKIIPRFYPDSEIVFSVYNESTQVSTDFTISVYPLDNGFISILFDFDFTEGDKYQFKITEGEDIVYRGKLIATNQETQNYLTDANQYYYE